MTHLVSPDAIVSIAGKEYVLDGSFGTLRALQHTFGKDIIEIQSSIHKMRMDEFAKLLSVLVECAGHKLDEVTIGAWLVDEVGITGHEHNMLRLRIMTFLAVAMSPNRERQKKRAEMDEILSSFSASHGENTESSV